MASNPQLSVTLFRDLPREGWPSMERYADELDRNLPIVWPDLKLKSFVSSPPHLLGTTGTRLTQFWRSVAYPLAASRAQGDINHIIDHSYAHLLTTLDPRRSVVTCHDLAPLAMRTSLGAAGISTRLWDWSIRNMLKAAHIICDSMFTTRELRRLMDFPEARTSVIPLAVAGEFHPLDDRERLWALRAQIDLTDNVPLLLHVGQCGPRKNIPRLLDALGSMLAAGKSFRLLQIGGHFTAEQQRRIDQLGLHAIISQLSRVPEADLPYWYNLANVFIFPSTYEGFGLPVLEAMACGTPVVCSRSGSLPEVAGDAALFVDAESPASIAAAVTSLLDSTARREELRCRGLARAATFTWRRTAELVAEVYRSISASSGYDTKDAA